MNDAVHLKLIRFFPELDADGWRYKGYKIHVRERQQRYDLRFEKFVVDKLAFTSIEIPVSMFEDRTLDLRDYILTKLRSVEIELGKKRIEQGAHPLMGALS